MTEPDVTRHAGIGSSVTLLLALGLVAGCFGAGKQSDGVGPQPAVDRTASPESTPKAERSVAAEKSARTSVTDYSAQRVRGTDEEAKAAGYTKSQGSILKLREASVSPALAKTGKPITFEMEYTVLTPQQRLDVSEEWAILRNGTVIAKTAPHAEGREPGRWRVRASLALPRGAKLGSYVLRSRVRAGKRTDTRDAQFTVVGAVEARPTVNQPAKPPAAEGQDSGLAQVQGRLKELGHDPGPIDGRMHPQTQAALKAFQQDYALPPTGELDVETRAALGLGRESPP